MKNIDIDIDFADRNLALAELEYIPAITKTSLGIRPHVGVYFQNIPTHPLTEHCAFDYNQAEKYGYTKIDFLNLNIYQNVKNEEHLISLINTEPLWGLLEDEEFNKQLFHLGNYSKLVAEMKPKSIDHLAMLLALIRPGKEHLIGKPWDSIEREIWLPTADGYNFKKSHSYGYAFVIVLQINLLVEQASNDDF